MSVRLTKLLTEQSRILFDIVEIIEVQSPEIATEKLKKGWKLILTSTSSHGTGSGDMYRVYSLGRPANVNPD